MGYRWTIFFLEKELAKSENCKEEVREVEESALKSLDKAICLICEEMDGRRTDKVIALAEILRDLVIARAILKVN